MSETADDAPAASALKEAATKTAAGVAESQGSSASARAVTINRPVGEVFAYFRDFANLPSFMDNVERIRVLDDARSAWEVKGPTGNYEWIARITEEVPDRLIAWTSEPGADVTNSGRVEFRDAGPRGTVVTATILYTPPGGIIGKAIAKLFQREPAIQARRDLRRFKQLMETGEIATGARNAAEKQKRDN